MGLSIDANSIVFGLNAKVARGFMVKLRRVAVNSSSDTISRKAIFKTVTGTFFNDDVDENGKWLPIDEVLKKSHAMTSAIIEKMIEEGYLANVDEKDTDGGVMFLITPKGADLGRLKFTKRLPRAKAEQKLLEFLDRVTEWNARDPGYSVLSVWLFGSMITDSPDVGDIDLICEYRRNPDSPNCLTHGQEYSLIARGKDATDEARMFIKKRSPHLSFDGFHHSELSLIQGGYVQIVKDGKRVERRHQPEPVNS